MCADDDVSHCADLYRDVRIAGWKEKAKLAARKKLPRNLYIITIHPDVLDRGEFRKANPAYKEGMPCLYVGITIHEPGDRYQQHKMGYRSSKYPKKYGIELALELMEGFHDKEIPDEEKEAALADWLRDQGYGVWQN